MRAALIVCALLACSSAIAQDDGPRSLGEIKQWQFHVQDNEVNMRLSASLKSPRSSVLSVRSEGDSKLRAAAEVDLLRQVLREMSSLGYSPRNLEMISTWLRNSEYREGVEEAVLKSGTWKACTGFKYCHQAEGVADQFLKSVDAFKEFDGVLREYGLRRKSIHVDDMGVGMKAEHIHCAGLIVISLEKEK